MSAPELPASEAGPSKRIRLGSWQAWVSTLAICLLFAVLVSAIQYVREAQRRSQCANNLKEYGLALHNYHDINKVLPPPAVDVGTPMSPGVGWHLRVLPFVEQGTLYDHVDWRRDQLPLEDYPDAYGGVRKIVYNQRVLPFSLKTIERFGGEFTLDDEQMKALWKDARPLRLNTIPFFKCPSDPFPLIFDGKFAAGSYSGSIGSQRVPSKNTDCEPYLENHEKPGGSLNYGDTTDGELVSGVFSRKGFASTFGDIEDGLANTILVGEVLLDCTTNKLGYWHDDGGNNAHAGTTVPINDFTTCANIRSGKKNADCADPANWNYSWGFRSRHPGGCQFLMGDGSARFINENVDYTTYQRLGGRKDGAEITTKW